MGRGFAYCHSGESLLFFSSHTHTHTCEYLHVCEYCVCADICNKFMTLVGSTPFYGQRLNNFIAVLFIWEDECGSQRAKKQLCHTVQQRFNE